MKVIHLPGSLSRRGGGVFNVALHHCKELYHRHNINVSVIGTLDNESEKDASLWGDIPTKRLKVSIPKIHQIQGLKREIALQQPDLIHSHMLWTSQSRVLSNYKKAPFIVSPHGMLDGWVMNRFKKIALSLYERKSLERAACIHALNEHEYQTLRRMGFKNPIAIIPNGIDFSQLPQFSNPAKDTSKKKKMLFLSRIDPKKGLATLIEAWSELEPHDWELEIYGWGDAGYVKSIESLIVSKGMAGNIRLKGEVHGEDKHEVFNAADAFILPSFSEGFPMVVLEAWQHKLPVLLTSSCNMPEAFQENAGFKISNKVSQLASDIQIFMNLGELEKETFGMNGFELAKKSYDWHIIGNSLNELYQWILKGGMNPKFVTLK